MRLTIQDFPPDSLFTISPPRIFHAEFPPVYPVQRIFRPNVHFASSGNRENSAIFRKLLNLPEMSPPDNHLAWRVHLPSSEPHAQHRRFLWIRQSNRDACTPALRWLHCLLSQCCSGQAPRQADRLRRLRTNRRCRLKRCRLNRRCRLSMRVTTTRPVENWQGWTGSWMAILKLPSNSARSLR